MTKKNMEGNKQKTNINKISHTADHKNLFLNKIQFKKSPFPNSNTICKQVKFHEQVDVVFLKNIANL